MNPLLGNIFVLRKQVREGKCVLLSIALGDKIHPCSELIPSCDLV